ncbi:MAG: ATP-binding cassette domain-containing protein [Clostridia bacterium]|nr:ATP-binding cassette domain-containing protein [Clostridia bacterium]
MFEFDKIPQIALEALVGHGVNLDDILIASRCDRTPDNTPCETYLFATAATLYVLCGCTGAEKKATTSLSAKAIRTVSVWNEIDFSEYALQDIETFSVEELISGARFVAKKTDGSFALLAMMTNFCRASTLVFNKYLRKIKNGETVEIDPDDDPKNACCPKCGMRYPDKNRKVCPKCMKKGKLLVRILHFFKGYGGMLSMVLASLVVLTAMGILAPYLSSGFFYDEVLGEDGSFYGQILLVLGMIIATKILSLLARIVNNFTTSKVAAEVSFKLKNTIFSAIQRLSLGFFTSRQTGGLMTQVNSDGNTIYEFFCDGFPYLIINVVQVVVLAILIFIIKPVLALCTLITIPIFFVIIRRQYRMNSKYHAQRYVASRSLNSMLSDVLTGIRVVKAFSKEKEEKKRFEGRSDRLATADKKLSVFNNYAWPISGFILYSGNLIAWALGGWMVIQDQLSYGELMTFIAYMNMIYSPMYFFNYMINFSADCSNAMQRLFEIMDSRPEVTEKADPVPVDNLQGDVCFDHVNFSYTKNHKVIDDVSFRVDAGEILGIVGHTGAGKSTLANLLMRLYDAEDGTITIDGINVKDMAFKDLYSNIAIVSQETYLFVGTILDNIKYACPDATFEEVVAASKCAGAHDFIMKLPDAYYTKIGFGYKDLSGGERQRLSIARAILRNPKILILDEATAAMDTKTEQKIQEALSILTQGKTTIMIAHRLSTLKDATKLIVIDKGKVCERGTHKELMAQEGVYHKLYSLQLEALKNAGITE